MKSEVVLTIQSKDAEGVKQEMKRVLNPRKLGIHIKRVLAIRRGVIIEVETKREAVVIKKS